ncbi:MAG: hypothetical protein GX605_02630 [Chloroflexi bacterium]|nr:hypothetical protein [Chloroflexota bacterium]
MVTSPADSGVGSLRAALQAAQSGDRIVFDLAAFPPGSPASIVVRSALPALGAGSVILDASGAGVRLDGSQASAGTSGLALTSAGNTVRGLEISGFPGLGLRVSGANNLVEANRLLGNGQGGVAIEGAGASGNVLLGNAIGVTAAGEARGNGGPGVLLRGGAHHNLVGQSRSEANIVGANSGEGLRLEGSGTTANLVQGNFVGTDRAGHAGLGNGGCGIALTSGSAENRVGGAGWGQGNIVSGNLGHGLCLSGSAVQANQVVGNQVGTTLSGLTPLPNGGAGVRLNNGASANTVQDNLIAGNTGHGVWIEGPGTQANTLLGNRIGSNAIGAAPLPNGGAGVAVAGGAAFNIVGRVSEAERNLVSGNNGPGIWLLGVGTTQNVVAGNLVGTDFSGFGPLPNSQEGLRLSDGAADNLLLFNLVSGNYGSGLLLSGGGTGGNLIAGNTVGSDLVGLAPLANQGHGIHLVGGASGNRIGGEAAQLQALSAHLDDEGLASQGSMANLVGHNGGDGVRIEGAGATGNRLQRNRITANNGLGIRLLDGGNGGLASPANLQVTAWAVRGNACADCLVELFADAADEGAVFLGQAQADGSGVFVWSGPRRGPWLTATATDGTGNTSAFSQPAAVAGRLALPLALAGGR